MIKQQTSLEPTSCQKELIDRKYGMFIHYGINTYNDTEWSDGTLPIESYNPESVDVDSWVKNAKDAGMKYIILITKHHDGFCLFHTKYTDYGVEHSSCPTDIVKEAYIACEKYGIKLGLYYSLWDRHEKCYDNHQEYVEYMCNQLKELCDGRYGQIVELWLDGGWEKRSEDWGLERLYDVVKSLQPNCAFGVNITIGEYNCLGGTSRKMWPKNYREGMPMRFFPSDFRLFDPHFTSKNDPKIYTHDGQNYYLPFEATICIRNMRNWFWDPKYLKDKLVSAKFIIKKYKHLVAQDNSLVINVAPNTQGKQEQQDIDRLLEVAKQLKIGIYE